MQPKLTIQPKLYFSQSVRSIEIPKLFAYHLKSSHVPQVENHCISPISTGLFGKFVRLGRGTESSRALCLLISRQSLKLQNCHSSLYRKE